MKINNRFTITKDKHNFTTEETLPVGSHPVTGKKAKHAQIKRRYFQRLETACVSIVRESVDMESMETIISSIEKSTADILAAIKAAGLDKRAAINSA